MNIKKLTHYLMVCSMVLSQNLFAAPAPSEQPMRTIERRGQTSELTTSLSKAIYRNEAYQAEYTERVAYQEQETYYEDVPYEVSVPYTDYEEYTDTEYKCHTRMKEECGYERECRQESYEDCDKVRECHNVPRRVCENEQVCENGPSRQECSQEQVCSTGPGRQECRQEEVCENKPGREECREAEECGTNARGERICKVRRKCETVGGGRECRMENKCRNVPGERECRYENKCRTVPGERQCRTENRCHTENDQECGLVPRCQTRSREKCDNEYRCRRVPKEECGYESVVKTRPVTRYRNETRYRQEPRTRTVTKYRNETRCCVTKYRDVFDHMENKNVLVRFPANAQLFDNEIEQLAVKLSDNGQSVALEVLNSPFAYTINQSLAQGQNVVFDLTMVAKYQASELMQQTIDKVMIAQGNNASQLVIIDRGQKPHIVTKYQYVIATRDNQQVLTQGEFLNQNDQKVMIPITQLPIDQDFNIQLKVFRTGVVINQPVQFEMQSVYEFQRLKADDLDKSTIKDTALTEDLNAVHLAFTDMGYDARLKNVYNLTVTNLMTQQIVHQEIKDQNQPSTNQRVDFAVPMNILNENDEFQMSIQVTREGRILDRSVSFELQTRYAKVLKIEDYNSAKKITDINIEGQGENTELVFKDLSPVRSVVQSSYLIVIARPTGANGTKRDPLIVKTMKREMFRDQQIIRLNLKNDLAVPANILAELKSGKKFWVDLEINRVSAKLNQGKKMTLYQSALAIVK